MHNKKMKKRIKTSKKIKKVQKISSKTQFYIQQGYAKPSMYENKSKNCKVKNLHPNYGTIVEKKQLHNWARNNSDMTFYRFQQ